MKMFKAWQGGIIETHKVYSRSEFMVTTQEGNREARRGTFYCWFEEMEDARKYIIDHAEKRLAKAERKAKKEREIIEKFKNTEL
jgi:hypothetical protein